MPALLPDLLALLSRGGWLADGSLLKTGSSSRNRKGYSTQIVIQEWQFFHILLTLSGFNNSGI